MMVWYIKPSPPSNCPLSHTRVISVQHDTPWKVMKQFLFFSSRPAWCIVCIPARTCFSYIHHLPSEVNHLCALGLNYRAPYIPENAGEDLGEGCRDLKHFNWCLCSRSQAVKGVAAYGLCLRRITDRGVSSILTNVPCVLLMRLIWLFNNPEWLSVL